MAAAALIAAAALVAHRLAALRERKIGVVYSTSTWPNPFHPGAVAQSASGKNVTSAKLNYETCLLISRRQLINALLLS